MTIQRTDSVLIGVDDLLAAPDPDAGIESCSELVGKR
jgi:hypothetical protein